MLSRLVWTFRNAPSWPKKQGAQMRVADTSAETFRRSEELVTQHPQGANTRAMRDGETRVHRVASHPHPSCVASTLLQLIDQLDPSGGGGSFSSSSSSGGNAKAGAGSAPPSITTNGPPWDVNSWRSYLSHRSWTCYKHGGHYTPGVARVGAEGGGFEGTGQLRSYGSHLVLDNVIYVCGTLLSWGSVRFSTEEEDKMPWVDCKAPAFREAIASATKASFRYGHSFSMIAGNWPQPIFGTIVVYNLKRPIVASLVQKSGMYVEGGRQLVGYWQPPTDFASHYHTLVEQVLPAFHTIHQFTRHFAPHAHDIDPTSGDSALTTVVLTSRPMVLPYSMIKVNGTAAASSKMADPTPVRLARHTCFAEPTIGPANENPTSTARGVGGEEVTCSDSPLGRLFTSFAGLSGVYGLGSQQNSFRDPEHFGVGESSPPDFPDDEKREVIPKRPKEFPLPPLPKIAVDDAVDATQERLAVPSAKDGRVLRLDALLVGNPTHCEPLWGPDPFFAEAIAQDQFIRGVSPTLGLESTEYSLKNKPPQFTTSSTSLGSQTTQLRRVSSSSWLEAALDSHAPLLRLAGGEEDTVATARIKELYEAFMTSFRACQHLHWEFREHTIRLAFNEEHRTGERRDAAATAIVRPPPWVNEPLDVLRDGVHVVVTSREGDWARQFNEDAVVSAIEAMFNRRKALTGSMNTPYANATIRKVKFTDSRGLRHKLLGPTQLDLKTTTILIGNHGANLIPSLYLRPNSGLITLSFDTPGFYPFSVFPSWMHVRDLHIEQACNRRLQKGKCKWSSGNNNDMVATEAQIKRIVEFVEEIVSSQQSAPRHGGLTDV